MSGSTRPCQAKHATLLGGTDRSSPRSHLFQFHLTRLQAANLPGAFLAHPEGSSPCQAMQVLGRNGSFSASVGLPAGSGRLRSAPGLLTRGWLCSAAARRRFAESAVHCRLQTVVELFFFLSLNTVSDSWLPCSH